MQDALKCIKQRIAAYAPTAPVNGLAVFAGVVDGKMETFVFDQLPHPLTHSLYRCDDHFVTGALQDMVVSTHRSYGYLVMDGNGALVATTRGPRVKVLQKIKAFIPSKHSKGGQSAMRYAHLRLEQRMMYRKECEAMARRYFIDPSTTLPNVEGIIIAGSAQFKSELQLDGRLSPLVLGTLDISYGNETGLREAIGKSIDLLGDAVMRKELKVLQAFFQEIDVDSDMYFYGLKEMQYALEKDAIKTLIVTRGMHGDLRHFTLDDGTFRIGTQGNLENAGAVAIVENVSFLEWALRNLEVVTVGDETAPGMQFARGFGGIGGILHYNRSMALASMTFDERAHESDDDEDEFM